MIYAVYKKKLLQMRLLFLLLCAAAGLALSCSPPELRYDDNPAGAASKDAVRGRLVASARSQIGAPYRSGGLSPKGFDCSGLTLFVYNKNRIRLPRTAAAQFAAGKKVTLRSALPGDLIFFATSGSRVSHVAIYTGRGSFVHAPSSGKNVRTDSLRNPYWKKHYCGTARFIR